MSCFIIAEIGINHNGSLDIAKKLIDVASFAGCDAVKFQKRTINLVYSEEYLNNHRESPWGTTQRDQKEGLEFGEKEYDEIDRYCKMKGIEWFASAWDMESQKFLRKYNLKHNKIASSMLPYLDFLELVASEKKYTFISTGMSELETIDQTVEIFTNHECPYELMHCVSTYPMKDEDANLKCIPSLRERYKCKVGYSGHEVGLVVSYGAAALGATSIERHITLNRAMYGSDQAASIEPSGLRALTSGIRKIQDALGDGVKRLTIEESSVCNKLRAHIPQHGIAPSS